jgi:hypothetical protein
LETKLKTQNAASGENARKSAVPAAQLAEWVQRLHHAGALRPAAAHARGQGDHGQLASRQGLHSRPPVIGGQGSERIHDILLLRIADVGVHGQAVLRQADAAVFQVGADLLVLRPVKAVLFEQLSQALPGAGVVFEAGQETVKQGLDQAAEFGA